MKTMKLFAMAFAALAIVSCSKEARNDTTDNPTEGSKAMITVKITGEGNQVDSKAVDPSGTEDTKVNNYIVFLFNKEGGIVGAPTFVDKTDAAAKIPGTTAAKTIYIVANTGAIATSPLKTVNSEATLKLATGQLIVGDLSTQTNTNLWMAGSENVGDFTPGVGTAPSTATVTVPLNFVAAKIDVKVVDARTNNTAGQGKISIADEQVALLFAGATGKFFATKEEQAVQDLFFSGITGYTDQQAATLADVLSDDVKTPFKDDANNAYHFYTFGNNGNTTPTILTIQSKLTAADGTSKTVYFPIQFTTSDAGYTIKPGQQYTVTLTLKGDINGGGGGGTTDPEEELKSADITVTVTPASWLPAIKVDKTFN